MLKVDQKLHVLSLNVSEMSYFVLSGMQNLCLKVQHTVTRKQACLMTAHSTTYLANVICACGEYFFK